MLGACYLYKPLKNKVDLIIPMFLALEYTFWPLFFSIFPAEQADGSWSTKNELIGYGVSFIVYGAAAYVLSIRNYALMALGYIGAMMVMVFSTIYVFFGHFQWIWGNYKALMLAVMAYVILAALEEMGGGKRDRVYKRAICRFGGFWSRFDHFSSVALNLARSAW